MVLSKQAALNQQWPIVPISIVGMILAPLFLTLVWLAGVMSAFGTLVISDSPSLIRFGSQASLALIGCLIVTLAVLPTIVRQFLPQTQGDRRELNR